MFCPFGCVALICTRFFFSSPISAVLSVSGLYVTKTLARDGNALDRVALENNFGNLAVLRRDPGTSSNPAVQMAAPVDSKLWNTVSNTIAMTIHKIMFFAKSFKALLDPSNSP